MSDLEKLKEQDRARDMTEGYKVIQALRSAMAVSFERHADVDENGVVTYPDMDVIRKDAVNGGIVQWRLELAFDKLTAEIRDETEYKLRKGWAIKKEAEREAAQKISHPPINGG